MIISIVLLTLIVDKFIVRCAYATTMVEYYFKYLPQFSDQGFKAVFDFNGLGDPRPRLVNTVLAFANIKVRAALAEVCAVHPALGVNWLLFPLSVVLVYVVVTRLGGSTRSAAMAAILYAGSPALLDTLNNYYLPAKPAMNVLMLTALFGGTLLLPAGPRSSKWQAWGGALLIFLSALLGLLADETAFLIFLSLPIIFGRQFLHADKKRRGALVLALLGGIFGFAMMALVVIPTVNRHCGQAPLEYWTVLTKGATEGMLGTVPDGASPVVNPSACFKIGSIGNALGRAHPICFVETIVAVHAVPHRWVDPRMCWVNFGPPIHVFQWPLRDQLFLCLFCVAVLVLLFRMRLRDNNERGLLKMIFIAFAVFIGAQSVLNMALGATLVETNYYGCFASLFVALILGLVLGAPNLGPYAILSWGAFIYVLACQFVNYCDTCKRHPYADRPALTWEALHEARTEVQAGNFSKFIETHHFPSRLFNYAFELEVARQHSQGRCVDLTPPAEGQDRLIYAIGMNERQSVPDSIKIAETQLRLMTSVRTEEELISQEAERIEPMALIQRLGGSKMVGKRANWNYTRAFGNDGRIMGRVWREGLLRAWSDTGVMAFEDRQLIMSLARFGDERLARIYHFAGWYFAFGPDGQLVTIFSLSP
ncbi:hypothetical protein AYO40_01970 [Planctomycetaceae bacterium SCGC AG-212-D15]|nr:hypothetical protein AYO40_01970 [Planctomycetaceae bacterium SCGC AG-212-D15]